ncbi:MAG TPA: acyltransferase [Ktedonobacterales bacterium]
MGAELAETLKRPRAIAPQASAWARWRDRLWPLENGRGAIPALDGLRAVAALSVVVYHATSTVQATTIIGGHNLTWMYFYTESGVDLFFVLSGFLLFLPFARAILKGRAAPRALTFYRRRALRILPAYYVCLSVIALAETLGGVGPSAGNVLAHLFMLHDFFPAFNRTISGPFWTLAVEWQFYIVLPWIAWLIARVSAGKPGRLALATAGVIALALAIREGCALINVHQAALPHSVAPAALLAVRLLISSQGKYMEVFGVGMLCAVVYLVAVERGGLSARRSWWIGLALLALSLGVYVALGPTLLVRRNAILAAFYTALNPRDMAMMLGPLTLGIGYGALLLGILLGPELARTIFSWRPLRFIGLISYSLYLWHESVINTVYPWLSPAGPKTPLNGVISLAIGFGVAIPVAYLSYQLVERPFLKMR